jgi:DNA ligase 1
MVMLAQSFERTKCDKGKHVKFPCIVQPKLDGIRCIATVENGSCTLYTRKDKVIPSVPHINSIMSRLPDGNYDGELYNHEIQFNELSGRIRLQTLPSVGYNDSIQFILYDFYTSNNTGILPYLHRASTLRSRLEACDTSDKVYVIQQEECKTLDEIYNVYAKHLSQGYEGSMIRTEVYDRKTKTWYDPASIHLLPVGL